MKKKVRKKNQQLKKLDDSEIDDLFEKAHHETFRSINCLDCANCCKTKGPSFSKKDINRISKHLNTTPQEFTNSHLKFNDDESLVLKTLPCLFLQEDNKCEIYSLKPGACGSYPHTNTRNIRNLLPYFENHISVCPAIEDIYNKI